MSYCPKIDCYWYGKCNNRFDTWNKLVCFYSMDKRFEHQEIFENLKNEIYTRLIK